LELSAVTIPANADANIQTIKSYDDQQRAASGAGVVVRLNPPGASGSQSNQGAVNMKTIQEQIAGFEAKRQALVTKNDEIMNKAAEDGGRTLDAAEQEDYDSNAAEMKSIDAHIVRLRDHEKAMLQRATPVTPTAGASAEGASQQRSGIVSWGENRLPKGTAFTRYALALARSKGNLMQAFELSKAWNDTTPEVGLSLKAAVAAGTTADANWAAPLVVYQNMASEFIELLRPATIVGRIAGLRRVPFNISMARTTAGSTSSWVGEDNPKPVSRMSFETISLGHTKIATIVVLTEELVRFSNPSAEAIVQADMVAAISAYMDAQFIDPTVTASANVRPASITYGASSTAMTGTTIATITNDVSTLFGKFSTANIDLATGVWVMHPRSARYLSLLRTTQDVFAFPGITQQGGTFFGLPVITSNSVPIDTGADTYIVLMNASDILLADDGGVTLDVSREASLQMDGAPSDSAASQISLWEKNLVGLRAERYINYRRRRDAAVAVLEDVSY
jgi:HK97 family phage major capsid protein